MLTAAVAAAAVTVTVDRTDDPTVTTAGSGAAACTAAASDCSLRGATLVANANPGSTINIPAGTYSLTIDGSSEAGNCGNAAVGDLDIAGNNTTITGAGPATTIIEQTMPHDRVMCVDQFLAGSFTFTISGVTITGGRETFGVGGGGMIAGAPGDVTHVSDVVFSNNQESATGGSPVGGGFGQAAGSATFNNVTFGGSLAPCASQTNVNCANQSHGSGGAAYLSGNGVAGTSFSITNSTFENNVSTNGDAGAVKFTGTNGSYSVSGSTFTGNVSNSAPVGGGAIDNESGTLSVDHSTFTGNSSTQGGALASPNVSAGQAPTTVSFSRITGNTATTAGTSGIYLGSNATAAATNNWWGCNGGPGATGCDAVGGAGTTTFNPWIVLKTTAASPGSVNYADSTTLTSSFLQNSSGGTISAANASQLIGLPVTWTNVAHGVLSNQQSSIQSNGTATATLTAGSTSADCGNVGKAEAKVDNVQNGDTTATASVTINCPDLQASVTNNVSGHTQLGNTGAAAQTWTWTTTGSNTGPGQARYANGQTILSEILPNSNITYGTVAENDVSGVSGTISCSIDVTDDLSCTANGSVSINSGGSFTVSFVATPTAPGTYSVPRSSGTCAIDPNNNVPETSDANNACSDSVTVTAPDLAVTQSNNASGSSSVGGNWAWKLHVANSSSSATATFQSGDTILTDDLDNSGNLVYGTPTAGNGTNMTNIGNVSCSISSNTLTCVASGGSVVVGTSGSFDVTFTATPSAIGTYAAPRSGGTCAVDPSNAVGESNESNNNCNSDSVTVTAPDLTISQSDNVGGSVPQGAGWNWTLSVSNSGDAAASFTPGTTILQDDLDSSGGLGYGTPTVTNVTDVSNSSSIQCTINGANTLTCTANGGPVSLTAHTGTFQVVIPVTSIQSGPFTNPRSGGICRVDPNNSVAESAESNNDCNVDTVTAVAKPDLTAVKTDSVGGTTTLPNGWTWQIAVANQGKADATFASGDTILSDKLPTSNVVYGTPTISAPTAISGSGSIGCDITANNLTCKATSGSVTIGASTGAFDVSFSATPSAVGTFANPRAGGSCSVDPGGVTGESNTTNNACSDSVTVTAPDLTATKTDNVSNQFVLGGGHWVWQIAIANGGGADATFTDGQTILVDNLPDTGVTYNGLTTGSFSNVTGSGNVSCAISGSDLTCKASGGPVTIKAVNGSFDVRLDATPSAPGAFANPRAGGSCSVDPKGVITESDTSNNACSDSVTVSAPDLTATKTDNVGGHTTVPTGWTWTITIANTGNASAEFGDGQSILTDNMPAGGLSYGTVSVGNATNATGLGNVVCAVSSGDLSCRDQGSPLDIAPGGHFDISFAVTPSVAGVYANPRPSGVCTVNPGNAVAESDTTNNACSDTVTVAGADLTATKSDDAGGQVTLGSGFNWKIHLANSGSTGATFTSGETILRDDLPTGATYGTPSVANQTSISGSGSIACAISSGTVTCTASGGDVTIGAGSGAFDVSVGVTPGATGTLANPRAGGSCSADPANVIAETNETNNACSDSVKVLAKPTTIKYSGSTSGEFDDPTLVSAKLTSTSNGAPLAGKPVTIGIGAASCSAMTNGLGIAICALTPHDSPAGNPYTITAGFAGDATYAASTDTSRSFTITREESVAIYAGPTVILRGKPVTLKGRLFEDGNPAVPLSGRTLILSLGLQTCTGATDPTGTASCTLTPAVALGLQPVAASFGGDAYYRPSTSFFADADRASVARAARLAHPQRRRAVQRRRPHARKHDFDQSHAAVVFAFPSSGAFTLGDRTAAAAGTWTTVTWWASNWSARNALSGGTAPSTFDGFAGSISALPGATPPASCSGTWATSASATPPPSSGIPSYMGVLVTTKVTRSGATFSGDFKSIVVVKTNSGYQPNPQKPGTGTIVATFCR